MPDAVTWSHFEVLGVSSEASDEEIAAAYHRLARQSHPDAHPDATATQRAGYEAQMTRINLAYEAIKTAARRDEYRRSLPTRSQPGERTVPVGRCDWCGATPAAPFRYPSGRTGSSDLRLCARCAATVTMPRPVNTHALGRYVVCGLLMAGLLVGAVLFVARHVNVTIPSPDTTPKSVATTAVEPWVIDTCVTARPQRDPVECAQPHDGVITARVPAVNLCPAGTDDYHQIRSTKQIACIDDL